MLLSPVCAPAPACAATFCNPCHVCVSAPCLQLDDDEIRAAYRKLALQLHPDRHVTKDATARAAAAEQFAALLKAYDTLRDPEQRALYNAGQIIEASLKL